MMYTYTVAVIEKFLFIYRSIFVPFLLNGTEANGNYSMIATVCEYDKCSTVYYYTCICWMFGRQHACIRVRANMELKQLYTIYTLSKHTCIYMYMQGIVVSCDPWFASLFGYPNTPAVMGQSIFTLIPSISLPHSLEDWEKVNV